MPFAPRSVLFACLALVSISGCSNTFQMAVGPNADVSLFSDFALGDDRAARLTALFGDKIEAPVRPEAPFQVSQVDSSTFRMRQHWRNLIFLGDMTGGGFAARTYRRIYGEEAIATLTAAPAAYRFARDIWADGQTVLFIHASSDAALGELLAREGEELRGHFEQLVVAGLTKTLYFSGEQTNLSQGIHRRHGYHLRVPKDFFIEEQPENRFVRLKQMMPSGAMLYLYVYYQKQQADTLNPYFAMAVRDTLASLYSNGDRIEHSRTEVKPVRFLGRDAYEIYGLYQNFNPPMGGPFKLFCFHDGGRLYLIDLSVFNPPTGKLPQLRILQAVAETFSTEGSGS